MTIDADSDQLAVGDERPRTVALRIDGVWVLAVALAGAFLWGQVWFQRAHLVDGPPNEFLVAYGAARTIGAADIYDPAGLAFERSPLTAILIAPLSALPYPNAYWIWSLLGAWSVFGFALMWKPSIRAATLIAAAVSAPLFLSFLDGRALPLALLALAAGAAAARADRPFRAGVWLSLCLIEFQLFVVLPLIITAQRRWTVLRGFLLGALALLSLTTWTAGIDWPWRVAEVWAAYPETSGSPTVLAVMGSAGIAGEWAIAVGLALAVCAWAIGSRLNWTSALGIALAVGLLMSPRAGMADAVMLLPAALALWASARTRVLRWTALFLLTPVPYLAGPYAPVAVATGAVLLVAAAGIEAFGARWATAAPMVGRVEQRA